METLRCLVCQGQSIADSDAEMAGDMRALVRARIAAGESPEAIRAWLIERYGDWVTYDPPLEPATWPLWAAPLAAASLSALWLARGRFRRRRQADGLARHDRRSPLLPRLGLWRVLRRLTRARCSSSPRRCCSRSPAMPGRAARASPGSPKAPPERQASCPTASSPSCARTMLGRFDRACALARPSPTAISARGDTAARSQLLAGAARAQSARRRPLGRPRQCAGRPRRRHDEPGGAARLPARRRSSRPTIPAPPFFYGLALAQGGNFDEAERIWRAAARRRAARRRLSPTIEERLQRDRAERAAMPAADAPQRRRGRTRRAGASAAER